METRVLRLEPVAVEIETLKQQTEQLKVRAVFRIIITHASYLWILMGILFQNLLLIQLRYL
jgi:hypothetical protein